MYAPLQPRPATLEPRMTNSTIKFLFLASLALAVVGCNSGNKAPPNTIVRVTNVLSAYASVGFRRVETAPQALDYKGSAQFTYNEDTYDFHVEAQRADEASPTRIINFTKKVLAGTTYDFVFVQNGATPELKVLTTPTPDPGATDAEVVGLHAAAGTPSVDVYLEPTGTDVTGAVPWGTVNFKQTLPAQNVPTGEYELTLTEPGNPANVLLTSTAFTLAAGSTTSLIIAPEAGSGVAPLSVLFVQDVSLTLYDKDVTAGLRVINAANDMGARDIVVNGDYAAPLFPAVPFATQTMTYEPIPVGSDQINVTPAGNPGVIELDETIDATSSQLSTLLVTGDPGTLTHVLATDDQRRIEGQASLHLFDAASQFTTLNFFVVAPGTDITTVLPIGTLQVPGANPNGVYKPGTYDLVVTDADTGNIVAGPQSITLESAKFYTVLAINGATSSSVDLVLLDDFN